MQKTIAVINLLLLMFFCIDSAYGQELWVDRNSLGGSCSDDRLREEVSKRTPWCSLGIAGSQAQPGDTVTVREGNYTRAQDTPESNAIGVLQLTVSGQPNAWIRIHAAKGEKVSITPQGEALYGIFIQPTLNKEVTPRYIEIAGFEIREAEAVCIEVFDTSDIVLRDLDVHGCVNGSVELEKTERVTLESSNIHDNPLDGNTSAVDLYKCGRDNIVRGNEISGNTDRNHEEEGNGVIMDTCLDQGSALIEDNVIYENQGWCVVIYASDNATVRNNSCKNNGTGSPNSFGHTIGSITTVGSFIDIAGNTIQPRDGSSALDIREDTTIGVKPHIWTSDWSTININNNTYVAEPQDKIIRIGSSDPVTVSEYKKTYTPWGKGDKQVDPKSSD